MATKREDENSGNPEEVESSHKGCRPLSDEQLEDFDPLKPFFLRAVDEAAALLQRAERIPQQSMADVVFSLAGRLIRATGTIITRVGEGGGGLQLPTVLARSATHLKDPVDPSRATGSIAKPVGDYEIVATTLGDGDSAELILDVLPSGNTPIPRPLEIKILDSCGTQVFSPVHVPEGRSSPIFPPLPPGVYTIEVGWPGFRDELCVEFIEDDA